MTEDTMAKVVILIVTVLYFYGYLAVRKTTLRIIREARDEESRLREIIREQKTERFCRSCSKKLTDYPSINNLRPWNKLEDAEI